LATAVLGDSDQLQLGDPLTILGYPGIGGETITLTSGNVGGFTAQRDYGDHAYIKTSATISGGTSGGIVLNELGQMVAIPTQLGSGEEENVVDCRVITDTNGDGNVNEFDACVPVGGFINALRPINLAIEMIETARRMPGSQ
jgi:S1-C subfamily serine protease